MVIICVAAVLGHPRDVMEEDNCRRIPLYVQARGNLES